MMRPTRHVRPHREPEASGTRLTTPLAWSRYYPGDHLRLVRGWPLIARAVYRELLDAQWDLEVLPAAPQRLREIVGASAEQWRIAWSFCARHFPRDSVDRRNPELERLRAIQIGLVERCRRAARLANRARWGHRPTVVPLRPGGVDD
jgi:hypothetical protein